MDEASTGMNPRGPLALWAHSLKIQKKHFHRTRGPKPLSETEGPSQKHTRGLVKLPDVLIAFKGHLLIRCSYLIFKLILIKTLISQQECPWERKQFQDPSAFQVFMLGGQMDWLHVKQRDKDGCLADSDSSKQIWQVVFCFVLFFPWQESSGITPENKNVLHYLPS